MSTMDEQVSGKLTDIQVGVAELKGHVLQSLANNASNLDRIETSLKAEMELRRESEKIINDRISDLKQIDTRHDAQIEDIKLDIKDITSKQVKAPERVLAILGTITAVAALILPIVTGR